MKRSLLFGAVLILCLCANDSFAQGPGKGRGRAQVLQGKGCTSLEGLGLSEEQRVSIQKIEALYGNEIAGRREKMMIKHLELQTLLRDPNASDKSIRQKSQEIGDLQSEIRERMIDYQIRIRSILDPDQMRQWCTLVGESALKKGWRGGL